MGDVGMIASVIVPVYRQWSFLEDLIKCLNNQTIDSGAFEVIIVNNESPGDAPVGVIPAGFSVLQCHKPGSYAARNTGMQASSGEWLVFTDADCLPEPEWLEKLIDAGAEKSVRAGRVEVVTGCRQPNIFERYDRVRGIPQDWYVSRGYAATANLAVHREDALRIGQFDESRFSGGDADYVRRAVASGIDLQYIPDAVVKHPARDSWEALTIKVRRMRGGQLTAGSPSRRLYWAARSLIPPAMPWIRYMGNSDRPVWDRAVACAVEAALWGVGLTEALRLLLGGKPVRE